MLILCFAKVEKKENAPNDMIKPSQSLMVFMEIFFPHCIANILQNDVCCFFKSLYLCKTHKHLYEKYNQYNIQSVTVAFSL